MDFSNPSLLLVTAGLILSTISLLILNSKHRKHIKDRLANLLGPITRDQKSADAKTPPRSTTPEKKAESFPTHEGTLPPSTRGNLSKAATVHSNRSKLDSGPLDEAELRKNLLPFDKNYKECGLSAYTPMGISVEEIEALSDFPDYSALSDVPLPRPYTDFDINKAIARPYRPFRWAYHQTMSLSNLEPDWWLELEKTYVSRIREREALYKAHSNLVLQYLPGSELGCKEVMEHALQFLCARYPMHFSLSHTSDRGYIFKNGLLKNETVIKDMHPLFVLLHNVPEDFAVMVRNPDDGLYYFRAGVLCSSLGWNVDTKIGMVLREIHGPIPDYREKMAMSMDRFFSKLPPSRPIQRGSWGLEIDTPLFMPPGDPHETLRLSQPPFLKHEPHRIHLRVDWQTLRRLPVSGSIIFNFKALFTQIEEFRDEPGVPRLVATILQGGKRELMEYKNTWHVEHVALPLLEEMAREQEREGVVKGEEEVRTLEEAPFFGGWEGKWHEQQGF